MGGGTDNTSSPLAIAEDDVVIRFVKAPSQLTWDDLHQRYVLSDQAFSAMKGGVSVELEGLYQPANTNIEERATKHGAIGAFKLKVSSIRAVPQYNNKGKEIEGMFLDVTHTPHPEGEDNEFHCDITPPPSGQARKKLLAAATEAIEINQDQARELKKPRA